MWGIDLISPDLKKTIDEINKNNRIILFELFSFIFL